MPIAHCVSTRSGIISSVDAAFCALVQRPREDLVGLSYQAITVADDIPKSARMLQALLGSGIVELEKRYHRPDGTIVTANLLVSRLTETEDLAVTLSWREPLAPAISPSQLWRAALHVQHLYLCQREELGPDLFGEYVGSILVHVYLAEAEGRAVTVGDIAAETNLSLTATGRWVNVLCQRDLLHFSQSADMMVQLTHLGLIKIERLLTVVLKPIDVLDRKLAKSR